MGGQPSGPSILIVEGQRSLHALIVAVLARAGLTRFVIKNTSSKALNGLVPHDVVLIDSRDRRQDPVLFEQLIVASKEFGAVILLMATSTDRGSVLTIREGLCDLVLLKPFTEYEIRRKLESRGLLLPPKPKLVARTSAEPVANPVGLSFDGDALVRSTISI